jgi:hypothetical protein
VYTFPESDSANPTLWFDLFASNSPGVQFYTAVAEGGEDGLAGIEFHPNYPTIPKFYAYHSASPTSIQVTVWSVSGGKVDYSSGEVLLDFPKKIAQEARIGGDMKFDSNGDLFISVGDTANTTAAQDPYNLLGKILRITPSAHGSGYTVPNSNPFARSSGRSEVFSLGYRNPRKILFPSHNSKLIVSDVGEIYDELNEVQLGDNNGWDYIDGCLNEVPHPPPGVVYKSPSYQYTFTETFHAITLGVLYPRTSEKNDFTSLTGNILFADLYTGQLFAYPLAGMSRVCETGTASFVAQAPSAVSVILLIGNTLYVADPFGGFYGSPCFARLVAN